MGDRQSMRKILSNISEEVKMLPKVLWIAAAIIPGVFTVIGIYLASKSFIKSAKENHDKGRDS